MDINESLIDLYSRHWPKVENGLLEFTKAKFHPASPLLLTIDEQGYRDADIRIMFCGQETNGWCERAGSKNIKETTEVYDAYFTKGNYLKLDKRRSFWQATGRFQKHIKSSFPAIQNIYPVWNNISKFGVTNKKGMTEQIRNFERQCFPVFREELAIINPDVIVFMTGPYRDGDIEFHLPDLEIKKSCEEYTIREVATVESNFLKRPALRIYHPSSFGNFNRIWLAACAQLERIINQ
jgi:hypothetical protein